MSTATVTLWGTTIGYVSMESNEPFARFEYDPEFATLGVELAPLQMPLRAGYVYRFADLNANAFHGLPGLIADSLPDKYGNRLIDVWLAKTGRLASEFNAVDRLCYAGNRAMGALEFEPSLERNSLPDKVVEMQDLIELASMAFADRSTLNTKLASDHEEKSLLNILSMGTSAGGARAKAVIAFNPTTKQVRSGQLDLPENFEHWLIKFDGVAYNGDWGIADPMGYGLLEYSYYHMAKACGINIMESQLLNEHGRHHFMTRRFDRGPAGEKRFVQTFAAVAHFDYYESGYYSYEQLFMTMRRLDMPKTEIEEQFRRVVYNVVGCNQDDHVKNFAFMMNRKGQWTLTPAYDLCHSEGSDFTRFHQLSINGKTTNFTKADLKHLAKYAGLPNGFEKRVLEQTLEAFATWQKTAQQLAIPKSIQAHVLRTLRMRWD